MRTIYTIVVISVLIFTAMIFERFTAERDFTNQLVNNGTTNFIFKDNIIVDNVRIIKGNK